MLEKIMAAVREIAEDATGQLGFGFLDFKTGKSCCLSGEKQFPTASIFKIFVLIELYRQIQTGQLSESQRLLAAPENAALGSGGLKRMRHGTELSLHDHAVLMMMISDNTSSDLLFDLVGRENIRKNLIEPLELTATKIDLGCSDMIRLSKITDRYRGDFFLCKTEESDCTSPEDILSLLQALHDGTVLDATGTERVLSLMRPYPQYHRLEKYLPVGTRIARKTGSLDRVANDVGIVFTDKGDYAIAVFYNGNTASREEYDREEKRLMAEELISRISQAVYDIYAEEN